MKTKNTSIILACWIVLLSCTQQKKQGNAEQDHSMLSWESVCQDSQVDCSAFLTCSSYSGIVAHGNLLDLHAKQDTTNKYYARLLEKYKEDAGITELIISEQKAWLEYYEATSEVYSKILLSQQLQALKLDKSKFHRYLNARFELAHKVNVYDESCILHYKSVILGKMFK